MIEEPELKQGIPSDESTKATTTFFFAEIQWPQNEIFCEISTGLSTTFISFVLLQNQNIKLETTLLFCSPGRHATYLAAESSGTWR